MYRFYRERKKKKPLHGNVKILHLPIEFQHSINSFKLHSLENMRPELFRHQILTSCLILLLFINRYTKNCGISISTFGFIVSKNSWPDGLCSVLQGILKITENKDNI